MAGSPSATPAVELIKLQSSDGDVFEVPIQVARVSRTLSTMLAGQAELGVSFEVVT